MISIQIIIYIVFITESTKAVGGIFGLKALTGDMPYFGFGNPWINYPRVAHGGAGHYFPTSSWDYSNLFGGFGHTGAYNPYQPYLFGLSRSSLLTHNSPQTIPSRVPNSSFSNSLTIPTNVPSSNNGRYYKGRGNPWINQA
uniref:Uncharacterized protein n=1 Tax=Setaria digitata TaxID=48799 RepID=A0A915PZ33_9BILA